MSSKHLTYCDSSLEYAPKDHNLDLFSPEYISEQNTLKKNSIILSVQENLLSCGKYIRRNWYCKKCELENKELALLRVDKPQRLDCQIRYCSNPDCVNTRFARIKTVLDSSKRLTNLKGMFHFTIGFNKIEIKDFKKAVQEQRRNINAYFSKLRKQGVDFNGFMVLDISKGKPISNQDWDGKYYVHYHVITIPLSSSKVRSTMIKMKQVEREIKSKQRKKYPFFVKVHGIKNKESLFSYLSIRAVGLYKPYDFKEKDYSRSAKALKESISHGKFMFLNQIVDLEQYCDLFYKRRTFSVLGTEINLQGSIILDNVVCKYPNQCKIHGHLSRSEVRMEMIFINETPGPPDIPENSKIIVNVVSPDKAFTSPGVIL